MTYFELIQFKGSVAVGFRERSCGLPVREPSTILTV